MYQKGDLLAASLSRLGDPLLAPLATILGLHLLHHGRKTIILRWA